MKSFPFKNKYNLNLTNFNADVICYYWLNGNTVLCQNKIAENKYSYMQVAVIFILLSSFMRP